MAPSVTNTLAGLHLRDLEYVIAVAEQGHFGRAAEACGVSQPALSTQVRKLEAWIGFAIFERLPGNVLVTPKGRAFVDRAAGIVAAARDLVAGLAGAATTLSGPFRLGGIPTLAPYLLPWILQPIRKAYPQLHLVLSELTTEALIAALRSGALDAALLCSPVEEAALLTHPLFHEPMLMMHPADEDPVWPPPAKRLILLQDGHCLRDQVLAACGVTASTLGRHATGLEILRHMVAAGEGVSLMPLLAVNQGGPSRLVRYTPVATERIGRDVFLAVRRHDPRGALLTEFAQLLRRHSPKQVSLREVPDPIEPSALAPSWAGP